MNTKQQKHEYYKRNKDKWKNVYSKKDGRKEYLKKYREDNKEKRKEYLKKNKDKIRGQQKEYLKRNGKRIYKIRKEREKEKYHKDENFRLAILLRTRTGQAMLSISPRRKFKNPHETIFSLLGAEIPEIRRYLEGLFKEGMSWDNYGRGVGKWEIDHIRPLSSFKLVDEEERKMACHYKNLQPLWGIDNRKKFNKHQH